MKFVDLGQIEYLGADIVAPLIEQNNKKYARAKRQFKQLDLLKDNLPKADLIVCRDALVHFSFNDIALALKNMQRSQSTYLLTTTFTNREANTDIVTGHWRPLNLRVAPFNLPPPLLIIDENCQELTGQFQDKSLALWRLADII